MCPPIAFARSIRRTRRAQVFYASLHEDKMPPPGIVLGIPAKLHLIFLRSPIGCIYRAIEYPVCSWVTLSIKIPTELDLPLPVSHNVGDGRSSQWHETLREEWQRGEYGCRQTAQFCPVFPRIIRLVFPVYPPVHRSQ